MMTSKLSNASSESSFEAKQPQEIGFRISKISQKTGKVDLNKSWDFSQSLEESKNAPKDEDSKDRLIADLK